MEVWGAVRLFVVLTHQCWARCLGLAQRSACAWLVADDDSLRGRHPFYDSIMIESSCFLYVKSSCFLFHLWRECGLTFFQTMFMA